jgi:hypothetical protein
VIEVTPQNTSAPRAKRRYTIADKVRAANRRNLEQASAVPEEVHFRLTPKRLAACREESPESGHSAQAGSPATARPLGLPVAPARRPPLGPKGNSKNHHLLWLKLLKIKEIEKTNPIQSQFRNSGLC